MPVDTGGMFVLDRVDSRQGASGWEGHLQHPDGGTTTLGFQAIGDGPQPPDHCDGLAIAFLPLVMRRGGGLHVRGSLTRGAIRNLTEYAEAWASWSPAGFGRVVITADAVLDGLRPPACHEAVCAWSGSLKSTHTLVRHLDALAPGTFRVRAAVRVLGLRPNAASLSDADTLLPSLESLGIEGVPLLAVRTNAATAGAIDREIGPLPLVAAALHMIGGGCSSGLHSRSWPLTAQLRYPRPGVAIQDLLCGDTFAVRADGGAATPPRMVADVGRHRALARVLSDCRDRERHEPPCGRCPACDLLALAFVAWCGDCPLPTLRLAASRVARLPFQDPVVSAEAEGILEDWGRGPASLRTILRLRVGCSRLGIDVWDHWRWVCAALGVSPPWPR